MRKIKKDVLLRIVNNYIIDSPSPSNISYMWNFGSLLGLMLVWQIVTGISLGMHYNALSGFSSVERIMREIENGYALRYMHSNGASVYFILIYLHIGRGIYYGSYKKTKVWIIGIAILLISMGVGFLGYTLPYGQMSLWGATVITNLVSALPYGENIVEWIWGGYSVGEITINRFLSIHYALPFVVLGLVIMHIITLHEYGSSNPLGITGRIDKIHFHPYLIYKDLVGIVVTVGVVIIIVYNLPNKLNHADNSIEANNLVTPAHIEPEWYFLPYYAILRSIPSKEIGVIGMISSILVLGRLPFNKKKRIIGNKFNPIKKIIYWIIVNDIIMLGWIGSEPVEEPYVMIGQVMSIIYMYIIIFGWI